MADSENDTFNSPDSENEGNFVYFLKLNPPESRCPSALFIVSTNSPSNIISAGRMINIFWYSTVETFKHK